MDYNNHERDIDMDLLNILFLGHIIASAAEEYEDDCDYDDELDFDEISDDDDY